jgi:hypothetical protein
MYGMKYTQTPSSTLRRLGNFALAAAITCLATGDAFGQSLKVSLLDGQEHEFNTADIQSIKFVADNMAIYQNDGSIDWWNIAEIANYSFELSSLNTEASNTAKSKALHIYPNPGREAVCITYTGAQTGDVRIEVLDLSGKAIEVLYQGTHTGYTKIFWDGAKVAPGWYLCRVQGKDGAITEKIIVQ